MNHQISPSARLATVMLILAATMALLVTTPDPAAACSCMEPPPPTEAMADSDAVFLGEVVETRLVGSEVDGELFARIAVEEVWKGEVAELVEVRTQPDSAMCGYHFTTGARDLIYAHQGDDGSYSTHLCTRTAPADAAEEDLTAFGEGRAPLAGEHLAEDDRSWLVFSAAGLAIVVAIVLIVAGIAWRRRGPARP